MVEYTCEGGQIFMAIKTKKVIKKTRKAKKRSFRLLVFGGISIALILAVLGYVANISFDIVSKYKEKSKLSDELEKLKEEEQVLSIDVEKLKDPEYVARYLREKFLYSKDGEYIIKMPEEN